MFLGRLTRFGKRVGQVFSLLRDRLKPYPSASIGPLEAGLAVYALTSIAVIAGIVAGLWGMEQFKGPGLVWDGAEVAVVVRCRRRRPGYCDAAHGRCPTAAAGDARLAHSWLGAACGGHVCRIDAAGTGWPSDVCPLPTTLAIYSAMLAGYVLI